MAGSFPLGFHVSAVPVPAPPAKKLGPIKLDAKAIGSRMARIKGAFRRGGAARGIGGLVAQLVLQYLLGKLTAKLEQDSIDRQIAALQPKIDAAFQAKSAEFDALVAQSPTAPIFCNVRYAFTNDETLDPEDGVWYRYMPSGVWRRIRHPGDS